MSKTHEEVLNEMLIDLDDKYDKSKGQFTYDILSAVAKKISEGLKENEIERAKKHIDTSEGKDLERNVRELSNTKRKRAEKAHGTIKALDYDINAVVKKGDIVSKGSVDYEVIDTTVLTAELSEFKVKCTKAGVIGNAAAGEIKYISKSISGLRKITNENEFKNGFNEETDQELKERHYSKIGEPATTWNDAQYKIAAEEVAGVGKAKVISNWNGRGTIKIVIIDSNKSAATEELIQEVYNHITENQPSCSGELTVVSAEPVSINIDVSLDVDILNYTVEQAQENVKNSITEYLKNIAFIKDHVSYSKVSQSINNSDGIEDNNNLLLNGSVANIAINPDQIAVIGVITFE